FGMHGKNMRDDALQQERRHIYKMLIFGTFRKNASVRDARQRSTYPIAVDVDLGERIVLTVRNAFILHLVKRVQNIRLYTRKVIFRSCSSSSGITPIKCGCYPKSAIEVETSWVWQGLRGV